VAKKDEAAFKEWADEQLGTLQGEDKAAFEKMLGSEKLKNEVFGGFLREREFHRRLTESDQKEKAYALERQQMMTAAQQRDLEVQKWYNDNKPYVEALSKEKAELEKQLLRAKKELESAGVDPKEYGIEGPPSREGRDNRASTAIEEQIRALTEAQNRQGFLVDKALPRLLGDILGAHDKAIREGWKTSAKDILDYSLSKGVTPTVALEELTRTEREEREATQLEKLKKEWMEAGRREALSKASAPDSAPSAAASAVFTNLVAGRQGHAANGNIDRAIAAWTETGATTDSVTGMGR
jgi:hypothetical protein